MKKHKICDNIERFNQIKNKSINIMQKIAEVKLNPLKHPLLDETKKRLKWMYIIHFECDGKISKASRKIGISRTWLSIIHIDGLSLIKILAHLNQNLNPRETQILKKELIKILKIKLLKLEKILLWQG